MGGKTCSATAQQKAKGRRTTSPVLLPFPAGNKRGNGFALWQFLPGGRAASCPALALCIRRRYVTNWHRCQCSATKPRTVARAPGCPAATALAACEPQGLDGCAVGLGADMKAAVVKRRRDRSGTNVAREGSRWRGYAFGALSGGHGVALQASAWKEGAGGWRTRQEPQSQGAGLCALAGVGCVAR